MAPLLPRIFLLSNLLNSFILHLVPKKFRSFLPSSWYNAPHQPAATHLSPPENPTAAKDPAAGRPPLPPPTPTYLPRVDTAELQRVFKMFDGNGDGTITMDELRSSLKNMGIAIPDPELVQMIDRVDVNGDGCVDMEEFQTLYRLITDERDEEEDIANAFDVFDKNGDGFITVEELRTVLSSLGLEQGRREEDCKRMIMKVDVDGDGMVSLMEFKQMMRDGSFVALR